MSGPEIKDNDVSSRLFLFKFSMSALNNTIKSNVLSWLQSNLDILNDPVIYTNYDSNYAFNIITDQNSDSTTYTSDTAVNILEIMLYMDYYHYPRMDSDNIIITDEIYNIPTILPSLLITDLTNIPSQILEVGISGMTDTLGSLTWWSMIGQSNGYYCVPMYKKDITTGWYTTIENSGKFHWFAYPPNSS